MCSSDLEAREQLESYLKTFPLDTEKDRRVLMKLGVTDETQVRLRAVRLGVESDGSTASKASSNGSLTFRNRKRYTPRR